MRGYMDIHHLFAQFTSALYSNALLYFAYRASSMFITLFLYHKLSPHDFSSHANILATIFIILLWSDPGLRKSLPRFAPLFTRSSSGYLSFTRIILFVQFFILFIIVPLVSYSTLYILYHTSPAYYQHLISYLHSIFYDQYLIYISCFLFITEGIIAILRLIFYSRFWHHPFNALSLITMSAHTFADLIIITLISSSYGILIGILLSRTLSGIALIILAIRHLATIDHTLSLDLAPTPWRPFIKHSCIMWLYTTLKSLSERNFLLPICTYTLGAQAANMFKVAHDGALLFERTIIKTIGHTDTSLLAHVESEVDMDSEKGKGMQALVFEKLVRKIAALSIPLFGILMFFVVHGSFKLYGSEIFHIFLILAISYLIEVLLSPYERILEVKLRYGLLLLSYMPYIIVLTILLLRISLIGLGNFVLMLQGVRLVSSCLMVMCARGHYGVRFPWGFASVMIGVTSACSFLCSLSFRIIKGLPAVVKRKLG